MQCRFLFKLPLDKKPSLISWWFHPCSFHKSWSSIGGTIRKKQDKSRLSIFRLFQSRNLWYDDLYSFHIFHHWCHFSNRSFFSLLLTRLEWTYFSLSSKINHCAPVSRVSTGFQMNFPYGFAGENSFEKERVARCAMICEKDYRDKTATDATHGNQKTSPLFITQTHPDIPRTRFHTPSAAGTDSPRNAWQGTPTPSALHRAVACAVFSPISFFLIMFSPLSPCGLELFPLLSPYFRAFDLCSLDISCHLATRNVIHL